MPFSKRQKSDFYKLLLEQADKTLEGLAALDAFIQSPDPGRGMAVRDLEKEADGLRRAVVEALDGSVATPMDREDVFALSRAIDDMADYAKAAAEEMTLFEVPTDDFLRRMARALREAGQDIAAAVRSLRDSPRLAEDRVMRAKRTASFVERICREALSELLKKPGVVGVLKTREIYRHLSDAADRGNEAADIIGDMLVKSS
ncbi:MAG: DUF47 family protein [Elusimicrobiota bacterium]